jgi:predicted DNA binding CopG/RHH family protein
MALIESGKSFDKEENYTKMKKRMENMDSVQYPLRVPAHLYKKVKIRLAKDELKLRTILIKFLEDYIKE